jgi:hypothetical protein
MHGGTSRFLPIAIRLDWPSPRESEFASLRVEIALQRERSTSFVASLRSRSILLARS